MSLPRVTEILESLLSSNNNTRKWSTATITLGTGAAHSANDVVSTDAGAVLTFATGLAAGKSGLIRSSLVTTNNDAVFAAGAGYVLHLYSSSPTAQATNAAFNMTTADQAKYIGNITIGTLVDIGDTCAKFDKGHDFDFTLATGATSIYGKLVCLGGETTVTGKTITINLGIAAL